MSIDISVIMPMYNVEENYLRASIGSLLAQTKTEGVELIITDDGSTNGCGVIADEYALNHNNIHVIHAENRGAGPARNNAIKQAKGTYLAFLDADDLMIPDALEKMFDRAEHDRSEVVMINTIRFDSKKESQAGIHRFAFRSLNGVTNALKSPQLIYDTISCNKLIRRDFWERNQLEYPPTSLYEDIPVMTRALLRAEKVSVIRSVGYKWRFRELESKATTQKRREVENMRGRLAILMVLDKMYDEEVSDENILIEKQIKALRIDLKIYSHACIDMERSKAEIYMREIGAYIRESISDRAMQMISPVDKAMYEAMLQGDLDRFIKLADFSKNKTKECLAIEEDGAVHIKVPADLFGADLLDNTLNIRARTPKVRVIGLESRKGIIRFKTQLYFDKLNIASPEDQEISAALCDEHTGEEKPLPVTHFKNDQLTSKKGTVKDSLTGETVEYNYDGTGFFIDLEPASIGEVQNAVIALRYKNRYIQGITLLRNMSEDTRAKIESCRLRRGGFKCSLSVAEMKTIKISIEKSRGLFF